MRAAGSSAIVFSLCYGLGVLALAAARVSVRAWLSLYALGLLACVAIEARHLAGCAEPAWFAVSLHAAWLAAIFYGADGALAALNGPHRVASTWVEQIGGLELWFVLCPGVVSLALAVGFVRMLSKT